jgi:hypothetical protein
MGRVTTVALPAILVFAVACSEKETASPEAQAKKPAPVNAEDASIVSPEDEAAAKNVEHKPGTLLLPLQFARHTGDLDEMMKQRRIRALITIRKTDSIRTNGSATWSLRWPRASVRRR